MGHNYFCFSLKKATLTGKSVCDCNFSLELEFRRDPLAGQWWLQLRSTLFHLPKDDFRPLCFPRRSSRRPHWYLQWVNTPPCSAWGV